ncbi:MAG TPA: hypothetical protein VD927_18235 [Chryseosolibacter sp.]|nr:hypothetical protein [Chryseosolibacter sp.]
MRLLIAAILLLSMTAGWSQVTNNEIEYRHTLKLNDPWFQSSTNNASVEWDCINKRLTSTCLVYHNDQWFTVVPPSTGTYYINISGQECANLQGVQIVVLEGDPCKIDSYQLRMCVSYTDQTDMFVRIDSLVGDREYLINIDGFLGDQCDFLIQFSDVSKGIPVQITALKLMPIRVRQQQDSIVAVEWSIPDSLVYKVSKFSIYRKLDKEKSAEHLVTMPLIRNAYGQTEVDYLHQDTLRKEGQYAYSIYGHESTNEMVLLAREHFFYRSEERSDAVQTRRAVIPYTSPKTGMLQVKVLDESNEKQLFTTTRRAVKGKNTLVLDLTDYVAQGVTTYKITIGDQTFQQELNYKVRKR